MPEFDITQYTDEVLLAVFEECSEEIHQDTIKLLKQYDFKHKLEDEIKKRGLET